MIKTVHFTWPGKASCQKKKQKALHKAQKTKNRNCTQHYSHNIKTVRTGNTHACMN